MATDHNFRIKNGLEVGGILIVNSSGQLVVADITANQKFHDNIKLRFGNSSDLQIYHTGSHSYIDSYTGNLYINSDSLQLTSKTGGENYIRAFLNGAVDIYYDNAVKLATTSSGIDVTGAITTDGLTTSANINFGDNDKALFGNSSDLQIYHSGTHSYIKDSGTGNLYLGGSDLIWLGSGDLQETYATFNDNGAVNLYHDNSIKLSTTSTGASVTGDLSVSGDLNITGDINSVSVTDLDVVDKTITVGQGQSASNSTGSGLAVSGANANMLWDNTDNRWEFNKDVYSDKFITGNVGIYASGDDNHLHISAPNAIIGPSTTTSSNPSLGTSQYRWNGFFSSTGNFSGEVIVDGGTGVGSTGIFHVRQSGNGDGNGIALTSGHATSHRIWKNASGVLNIGSTTNTNAFQQDLAGNVTIEGTITSAKNDNTLTVQSTNAGQASVDIKNTEGHFRLITDAGELKVYDQTDSSERFRIDTSGNVGIGTDSPNRNLHIIGQYTVENSTSPSGALLFIPSSDANRIYSRVSNASSSSRDFAFLVGSTEAMRIDSSGDVGIGTNSPATKFHVSAGSTNANIIARLEQGTTAGNYSAVEVGRTDGSGNVQITPAVTGGVPISGIPGILLGSTNSALPAVAIQTPNSSSGHIVFNPKGSEKVRIQANGELLLNATSTAFSDKLYVNGDAYVTGGWRTGTAATFVGELTNSSGILTLQSDANRDIQFGDSGTPAIMYIDTSTENVGIGTTTPSKPLHVQFSGDHGARIESEDNHASLYIDSHTAYAQYIRFTENNANKYWIQSTGGKLVFRPTATGTVANQVIFDASGNVGIGTTSPASPLHVNGNVQVGVGNSKEAFIQATNSGRVASNPAYSFNNDVDTGMFNPNTDNTIAFATGGTERWRITSSGTLQGSGDISSGKIQPTSLRIASGGYTADIQEGEEYKYYLVGTSTVDNNWKKICDVAVGTGLYKALTMKITLESQNSNFGSTYNVETSKFIATYYRSAGTQDDQNNATLAGVNPTNHQLRIIKTATGAYELQILMINNYKDAFVKIEVLSTNAGTVTMSTGINNGSTTGTVYSASSQTSVKNIFNSIDTGTISAGVFTTDANTGTFSNSIGTFPLVTSTPYDYVAKFESTDSGAAIIIEDSNSTNNGNRVSVSGDTMSFFTAATSALTLDASQNATFAGAVSAEDNIYLTDAGTVRAKLLLNSSDRDNVELRAESIGSTMKFFTAATEALELDASQKASFKGSIVLNSNGKVVEIADAAIQWYSYPDSAYKQAKFRATDYQFKNGGNTAVMTVSSGGNLTTSGAITSSGNLTVSGDVAINSDDFVVSSSNSRVGINVGTPLATLDIDGDVYVRTGHTLFTDILRPYATTTLTIGQSTNDIAKFTGSINIGNSTIVDSSRNLTNIGTISSGAITSTGTSTFGGLNLNGGVDFNGYNINDVNQINATGATGWLDFNMDTNSVYPQSSIDNQTVLGSVTHMNFVGDSNGNGTGGIFYWGYGVDSADSGTFTQTMALDRSGNLTATGYVRVNSGGSYRLYNSSGNAWIQLQYDESNDMLQVQRGIKAATDSANDLGTNTVRWRNVYADTYYGDGSNLTVTAPNAPSITSTTVVNETIEIVFAASTSTGNTAATSYEVWSDGGTGSDYSLIAKIPYNDIASSMSVVDSSFDDSGTIAYRVYAIRHGAYSTAATTTRAFTMPSLDVSNMSVVPDTNSYHVQYNLPSTRFLDHVEIYVDAESSNSNLARSGASLVYSGSNPSYKYNIGSSDMDKYHQFWVEVVTV